MTGKLYEFPRTSTGSNTGEIGISSLHHPNVGTHRFRTNPKEFNWAYTLTKRVDQTYGGRVIQLLGTRIEDFTFKADAGSGRWQEINRVADFMRKVMTEQRKGVPATFEYTTRGWKFNAYITSVPFSDSVEDVLREYTISMKVQEDVSGYISRNTLQAELNRLQRDIAFRRSKYNDPLYDQNKSMVPEPEDYVYSYNQVADTVTGFLNTTLNQNFITSPVIPTGKNTLSNLFGGGGPV